MCNIAHYFLLIVVSVLLNIIVVSVLLNILWVFDRSLDLWGNWLFFVLEEINYTYLSSLILQLHQDPFLFLFIPVLW